MKQTLRATLGVTGVAGVTIWAIMLTACGEARAPAPTASQPAQPQALAPGETLTDVIRETLAEIVRDEDAYSRARRLGALLPTLGPGAVEAAKQTLEDRLVDLRASELELLLRYWATYEPEEASRWAVKESPTRYRIAAVFGAVSAWAESDPESAAPVALDWMSIDSLDNITLIALMRGWFAAGDPPALRQFLQDLPPGLIRQRAIAAYVRVLIQATGGGEAAVHWAESLPDENKSYKLDVYRRVVDAVSVLDIEAGTRWCETQCDGPYGNNMRSIIARNWVRYDGPAALAWLSGAPEGYERDLAVRVTFGLWGRTDYDAAMAWMADQTADGEPERWLRSTYPVYARLLAADRPAEAIVWAERIDKAQERKNVLIRTARRWRHLDEAAAEEWLNQSPLSEESRQKVRAEEPPTGGK